MTTATTIKVQFQVRQDTAANWTSVNPVLLAGELGRETDTGKIKIGNGSSVWSNLAYQPFGGEITDADISATAEIAVSKLADGAARQLLQTDAAGTGVEWTDDIDVPGTLDVTGAATFDDDVTIEGDLTVNGTTTTIDTTTLVVEDKNIEIGKVATPTDVTADGGGITLKGSTDKTINWVDATDAWTLSEHVDIASAKEYRIAGTKVLDATSLGSAVVSSSLTSVGTIGTGVWEGTVIDGAYLPAGSTSASGIVQLEDSTSSTSTTTAATPNSVKSAYDLAAASLPKTGGTMTGDIVFSGTQTFPGTGPGTVTSVDVTGGTGLTSSGGPITSSGAITVDLDDTAVTPGSYTYASITVDQQGRLTAASNGTTPLTSSDIGVTVQGYDADTAKIDVAQTFTAAQTFNAGASDTAGSFRIIPQNSQAGSYTLIASDTGKHISITTGGVTVPASVFSAGDVVGIYNNSSSNQTITQGSGTTLRQAGTANTGNRTLAQRGIATVLCVASDTFVISGAGLS